MRLLSWNVNGLRAVLGKGFLDFFNQANPDILCLQEIKALPEQVAEVSWPEGYQVYWNPAVKKGYSGTCIFTKISPLACTLGIGHAEHDQEGRVITLEFDTYYLVNVYTPNAQNGLARLDYRVNAWDVAFRTYVSGLQQRKPVVFCGDLNVAHQAIDLARPKANERNAGFTQEERSSFSRLLDSGFLDTFRTLHPEATEQYSWWSYRAGARARNIGWRIDYVCASEALRDQMQKAFILPEVLGSDHCPVGLDWNP